MKRSLFIAIVVLLMAALFVSCNAEKSMEDQLVEVSVAGELSRALDLTAESSNVPIANLNWYYTAEKKDTSFKTGETRNAANELVETAVKSGTGLITDTLGETGLFSKGVWEFKFFGYDETDTANKVLVYSAETTVTLKKSLSLTLTLKAETLAPATVWMHNVTYTSELINTVYDSVKLFVTVDNEPFGAVEGYEGTKNENTLTFAADAIRLDEEGVEPATYQAVFEVRGYFDGDDEYDVIGSYPTTVKIVAGMKYTITGSIDAKDITGAIGVGSAELPKKTVETATLSTEAFAIETANVPVAGAASTAKTTVSFDAESIPADKAGVAALTVETYSADAAAAKFQVGAGEAVVAGLSFSLTGISEFEKAATVTTYIEKNLPTPISVVYVGDTNLSQPTDVQYNPSTGLLTFKTDHFSDFYVKVNGEARIGDRVYGTLSDAIKAAWNSNETIVLLKDVTINATTPQYNVKNVTLDGNSKTVTVATNRIGWFGYYAVGNVTIKNLTIKATAGIEDYAPIYCDYSDSLTFENCSLGDAESNTTLTFSGNNCGGFVGFVGADNTVTFINCKNYYNITAQGADTGVGVFIAGYMWAPATIVMENCVNYGDITAAHVGYLLGNNQQMDLYLTDITITNCSNEGKLVGFKTAGFTARENARGQDLNSEFDAIVVGLENIANSTGTAVAYGAQYVAYPAYSKTNGETGTLQLTVREELESSTAPIPQAYKVIDFASYKALDGKAEATVDSLTLTDVTGHYNYKIDGDLIVINPVDSTYTVTANSITPTVYRVEYDENGKIVKVSEQQAITGTGQGASGFVAGPGFGPSLGN